jgi:hypothetical protein
MARRGYQRQIAQKIIEKKADYVLALKGNQGSLREDVELFAAEPKARGFADSFRNATIGPAFTLSSWSKKAARSAEKSSRRPAFT